MLYWFERLQFILQWNSMQWIILIVREKCRFFRIVEDTLHRPKTGVHILSSYKKVIIFAYKEEIISTRSLLILRWVILLKVNTTENSFYNFPEHSCFFYFPNNCSLKLGWIRVLFVWLLIVWFRFTNNCTVFSNYRKHSDRWRKFQDQCLLKTIQNYRKFYRISAPLSFEPNADFMYIHSGIPLVCLKHNIRAYNAYS